MLDTHWVKSAPVLVFLALAVPACSSESPPVDGTEPRLASTYDELFLAAGAEHDVPPELLKALSFTLTRYEMVRGEEEFEGAPRTFGLMALTAEMAGTERAKFFPEDNVRAAAAWLSARAAERGIDRRQLLAWTELVGEYSRIENPEARRSFVEGEVLRTLHRGVGLGAPLELDEEALLGEARQALSPDYDLGIWRPSPNFNSRSGATPQMVVIHTCEGAYSGCWGWLTNTAAATSAHYVVSGEGEVSQLVRESDRAWHVAAAYQCSNNANHRCDLNGKSTNTYSVGIEHAGYASQASFPAGQIDSSARLTCNITKRWGLPRDRLHIVSHAQLQPYNRTDPGANWPWATYVQKVKDACNEPPPSCDRSAGPLTFSCDGPQPGMTCVNLNEPGDPDTWNDNFLCSASDLGLQWSSAGPIAGMDCVNVAESSEPNAAAWADNFLCAPKQSTFVLSYSSAGPIADRSCVHLNETLDLANSWGDNYVCHQPAREYRAEPFTFKMDGPKAGASCVNVDEPADPDTWSDNHFCSDTDIGLQWSSAGPIAGLLCTHITEGSEALADAWSDNYLCVPESQPYRFTWSSAGPVAGKSCVRWHEQAETNATWLDNWLCFDSLTPQVPGEETPGEEQPDPGAPDSDGEPIPGFPEGVGPGASDGEGPSAGLSGPRSAEGSAGCSSAGSAPLAWLTLAGALLLLARRRRGAAAASRAP